MGVFTFNGTESSTYGVYVNGKGTYNGAELDFTRISVPGRNGDVIMSNGRYKNIVVPYEAYIHKDFKNKAAKARAWLLSPQKYCRLTDEYHPDEFRLALFKGPIDFDMRFMNKSGTCVLEFDCKPQRFLISGEEEQTFYADGVITNPTLFEAAPLITVLSSSEEAGEITIGGKTMKFLSMEYGAATLDCEAQNAYNGYTNLNYAVSGQFPTLVPGENNISFSGSIMSVSIIPRWWTL